MNLDYKTKIKIREIRCEEREANRINMLGEQIDDIVYREIEKARKYVKKTAKIEIISLSHAISFFSDFKRWQFPRLPRQYGFSVS